MRIWRFVLKEILYRKLGFLLGVISIAAAVGALVGAFTMLKAFVLFDSPGSRALPATLLYLVVPLAALHWLSSRKSIHLRVERLPDWACAVGYGVAVFLMLLFVSIKYRPFIYFQF